MARPIAAAEAITVSLSLRSVLHVHFPTLFLELTDHSDPLHPETMLRTPVTARINLSTCRVDISSETRPAVVASSHEVDCGHALGLGDVIVAVDASRHSRAWLAEVVAVEGRAPRRYLLGLLQPTSVERWVRRNGDPRWSAGNANSDDTAVSAVVW